MGEGADEARLFIGIESLLSACMGLPAVASEPGAAGATPIPAPASAAAAVAAALLLLDMK